LDISQQTICKSTDTIRTETTNVLSIQVQNFSSVVKKQNYSIAEFEEIVIVIFILNQENLFSSRLY